MTPSNELPSSDDSFTRVLGAPSVSDAVPDGCGLSGMRFALAATAAFSTRANGGLMPQARHGGRGKVSVAIVGSKFDGTGLEKEHIGHTHVPTTVGTVIACERNGLEEREEGEDADVTL